MHRLLFAALCCSAAHAAVIRGVVLDRSTGRPLARSLVTLRPVEGVGGKPQSVRADRTGQFAFSVSAGMYLLRASGDGRSSNAAAPHRRPRDNRRPRHLRIPGLEPGTYYVRTAAKQLEDGSGLLPTFHKETMTVDQSITEIGRAHV